MQSINTKYLSATNTKGSRIKAYASYGKEFNLTMPYDYALDTQQAHAKVAMELAKRLNWAEDWVCSDSEDQKGYVFVPVCKHNQYTTKEA